LCFPSQSQGQEQETDKDLYLNQMDDMLNGGKHLFRQNVGQWPSEVNYRCVSSTSSISFKNDGISFGLRKPQDADFIERTLNGDKEDFRSKYLVWNLNFEGARFTTPVGLKKAESKVNYFGNGSPNAKRIDISPNAKELTYMKK